MYFITIIEQYAILLPLCVIIKNRRELTLMIEIIKIYIIFGKILTIDSINIDIEKGDIKYLINCLRIF